MAAPVAPAATPWQTATNVVSIETARKAAHQEASVSERARAKEIIHWCAFAGKADLVEGYTASNMSVEQVRDDLLAQTAHAGFEINTQRGAFGSGSRQIDSVEDIYARRRLAIKEAQSNRRYF